MDALLNVGSAGKDFGKNISSTPHAFNMGISNFLADVWFNNHITLFLSLMIYDSLLYIFQLHQQ